MSLVSYTFHNPDNNMGDCPLLSDDEEISLEAKSKLFIQTAISNKIHNGLFTQDFPLTKEKDITGFSSKSNPSRYMRAQLSIHMLIGMVTGLVLGLALSTWLRRSMLSCSSTCCHIFPFSASSKETTQAYEKFPDPCSEEALGGHNRDPTKSLVFIGIMTANKYLKTRAPAVYQAWGRDIPGKMAFFSASTAEPSSQLPIIGLQGVDDSYPPQKKSFMMLKYIHDHCIDKFEWFMRADDDVFIRGEKLENFLRSINSSKPQFIGQAGLGNKEEFGLLSLEYDENFCMGGPGMVFSRETLKRMIPNVKDCLQNLYSTHEDVEVGRCVRKHAGIPCTWSYEMQNYFYHNSSGNAAFTGNLRSKEVHRAITLHPVKQHIYQHHVNKHFLSLRIEELNYKIIEFKRILRDLSIVLGEQIATTPDFDANHQGFPPSLNKWKPKTRDVVRDWDLITHSIYSYRNLNPRRGLETDLKVSMDNILMQVMTMINENAKQRGRTIDFKDILYGYSRRNPLHGADYILDLLLVYRKHKGRKMTVPVRRHAYLQQTFGDLQFRELVGEAETFLPTKPSLLKIVQNLFPKPQDLPEQIEKVHAKTIHLIIPLAGRYPTLKRFMTNLEKALVKGENIKTALILFKSPGSDVTDLQTVQLFDSLNLKYPNHEFRVVHARGPFNRGLGLEIGSSIYQSDSLLFFCDVDMIFTGDFLERVRKATILNKQVFFPIVYSQYDPKWVYHSEDAQAEDVVQQVEEMQESNEVDWNLPHHMRNPYLISKDSGYWRQFGFGIAAIYNQDFRRVGGFDTSIQGWGKEDVDLFNKFISSNLSIFRSTDPNIVHVYHEVNCDPNLPSSQLTMCIGTKASSYASAHQMAVKVLQTKEILMLDDDHEGAMDSDPGDLAVQPQIQVAELGQPVLPLNFAGGIAKKK